MSNKSENDDESIDIPEIHFEEDEQKIKKRKTVVNLDSLKTN